MLPMITYRTWQNFECVIIVTCILYTKCDCTLDISVQFKTTSINVNELANCNICLRNTHYIYNTLLI